MLTQCISILIYIYLAFVILLLMKIILRWSGILFPSLVLHEKYILRFTPPTGQCPVSIKSNSVLVIGNKMSASHSAVHNKNLMNSLLLSTCVLPVNVTLPVMETEPLHNIRGKLLSVNESELAHFAEQLNMFLHHVSPQTCGRAADEAAANRKSPVKTYHFKATDLAHSGSAFLCVFFFYSCQVWPPRPR